MLRRALQNLLLVIASLLVTWLVVELGLRLVGRIGAAAPPAAPVPVAAPADSISAAPPRQNARPLYDPSDRLGWCLHPDTVQAFRQVGLFDTVVRSNQFGFRGPELRPRPAGVVRYAVLGDSYGFGWGVEESETYAAQLEALLNANAAPGRRFEVVNVGLPGFGTFQRLQALEILLDHGLDGVIAEFSVSNDVVDDWRAAPYVPDQLGRYQAEGTRFPAFEMFWDRHSRLVALARRRLMPLRLWFECRRGCNLERTRELWMQLIDRCQAADLELMILSNPSRYQVLSEGEGLLGALARTGYSRRPNRLLEQVAAARDLPLVDGEQLFAIAEPAQLFLGRDPHWTTAGHTRVAAALFALEPLQAAVAEVPED